jgi:iron complex outermembrane receptor protein
MRSKLLILSLLLATGAVSSLADTSADIFDMPLEDLLNINVGVLNRSGERLLDTSASVSVVTAEDIRRSRATTIPEVLRLVPGISVARLFGGVYSVGIRGNQGRFADKILILMDGRPIYSPEFGGISWDAFDMYLPDIDRIEVIRGSGASLWGVNAINGIISIVTKAVHKETKAQGYVSGGNVFTRGVGGSVQGEVGGRAVRVSANHQSMENQRSGAQVTGDDNAGQGSLNVRIDSEAGDLQWSTQLRGNISQLDGIAVRPSLFAPSIDPNNYGYPSSTGFVQLGRLENQKYRSYFTGFQQSVQKMEGQTPEWRVMYGVSRQGWEDMVPGTVAFNIADIDAYSRLTLGSHRLLYGASGKLTNDSWENDSALLKISNRSTTKGIVTGFFQDSVGIFDDAVNLTVGTKIQYNDYSGFEHEPSVRMSSPITRNCTAWASWSRSVRIPNRVNKGFVNYPGITAPSQGYGPLPVDFRIIAAPGNVAVAEVLYSHELGVRGETLVIRRNFSWDVSLFYNEYRGLFGAREGNLVGVPEFQFNPTPHLLGALSLGNFYSIYNWGGDVQATLQLAPTTKVTGWYSGLYSKDPGTSMGVTLPSSRPRHQSMIRVSTTPWSGTEFDVTLRTSSAGVGGFNVADNRALDLRLGQTLTPQLSAELIGMDLLRSRHKEGYTPFNYNFRPVSLIQRGIVGRLQYRW